MSVDREVLQAQSAAADCWALHSSNITMLVSIPCTGSMHTVVPCRAGTTSMHKQQAQQQA